MANETAAQLLIRIAADPSQADASIKTFQANFGQSFTQLGAQLSTWSSQGSASFRRVTNAAKTFSTSLTTHLTSVQSQLEQSRTAGLRWSSDLKRSFTEVGQGAQGLQANLINGLVAFDGALGRNITTALIWQKSIGRAFEQAAVRAIGALAQESIVRALYSAALGFYLLAIGDFSGAGQAFESAALFGAVGGAAALAGRALAGGGGGGTARGAYERGGNSSLRESVGEGYGGGFAPAPATGAQGPNMPSGQLTVAIMGDEEAGAWVANTLNRAVTQQGVQLVATKSQRGAPVGH
jgi:hypothetical protein